MKIEETSSWISKLPSKGYKKLETNLEAGVVIVGGGLAGICAAYLLSKEGKSVVVLEKGGVGSGVTAYTTAFLTQDIDTDASNLVKMFGEKQAKQIWDSHGEAIDMIEEWDKLEKAESEFSRCSTFAYTAKEDGLKDLEEEFEAGKKIGRKLSLHKSNKFAFKNYGLLEIKDQAKFHPLKYLGKIAEAAAKNGAKIYEHTEVVKLAQSSQGWEVETSDGNKVTGKDLILATYYPFTNPKQTLFKKGMYVSYVFEVQIPKDLIPENLYLDDDNPYNYFRIDKGEDFDRMIIGGQDHRQEIPMDPEKNFKALSDYLESILPGVDYKIVKKWTGPILEPSDGLALIGETYPHQYVATAFSGNGMTYAHISAKLLTDLIMGRKNKWTEIYDPKRIPSLYQLFKKGQDYVGELFGGAVENIFKSP